MAGLLAADLSAVTLNQRRFAYQEKIIWTFEAIAGLRAANFNRRAEYAVCIDLPLHCRRAVKGCAGLFAALLCSVANQSCIIAFLAVANRAVVKSASLVTAMPGVVASHYFLLLHIQVRAIEGFARLLATNIQSVPGNLICLSPGHVTLCRADERTASLQAALLLAGACQTYRIMDQSVARRTLVCSTGGDSLLYMAAFLRGVTEDGLRT
mmetsp:Transcript_101066/g.179342  ORF Transcript_101066/g.179342 Transcript_101066/m.179342 type:complete len:210 (-) Transcript_101066:3543-4172(-)